MIIKHLTLLFSWQALSCLSAKFPEIGKPVESGPLFSLADIAFFRIVYILMFFIK